MLTLTNFWSSLLVVTSEDYHMSLEGRLARRDYAGEKIGKFPDARLGVKAIYLQNG